MSTAYTGVVRARGLSKTYRRGGERVHALRHTGLDLHPGELVALVGPSGSGKSTLLNVLCGWEQPEDGTLQWAAALADAPPARLRWDQLALIPQALGLLEDLTVEENVLLPARLSGRPRAEPSSRPRAASSGRRVGLAGRPPAGLSGRLRAGLSGRPRAGLPRGRELLEAFGIAHLAERYPRQTSLGEQQRCAAARALLLRPTLVLADEPTAHQDARWTDVIFTEFRDLIRAGSACLVATHNPETWGYADRIVTMHDGVAEEAAG